MLVWKQRWSLLFKDACISVLKTPGVDKVLERKLQEKLRKSWHLCKWDIQKKKSACNFAPEEENTLSIPGKHMWNTYTSVLKQSNQFFEKVPKYWDFSAYDCKSRSTSSLLKEAHMIKMCSLCWFQTSLPLAALPLCHVIIACCFRVAALSGNAALAISLNGIAPELNRIQLSAICRGGQSGKVIDLLAWRCLPLGHPSAASGACAVEQISSGACAVEQISSSKRQCGKWQVSLKPALSHTSSF